MTDPKNRDFMQRFRGGIWFVVGAIIFVVAAILIA